MADVHLIGRRYWIAIWYGILIIGIVGLFASVSWGKKNAWRNLDEVLRAIGTMAVALAMLLWLYRFSGVGVQLLFLFAVVAFVWAFIQGRRTKWIRENYGDNARQDDSHEDHK